MTDNIDLNKLYFTADWHFGHKNIIEYCKRPFKTVDEMNEALIVNYNEKVSNSDTCIFVGDFVFYDQEYTCTELLKRLNGKKILVKGNHDWLSNKKYIKAGFIQSTKSLVIDGYRVVHRPGKCDRYNEKRFIVAHVHEHWRVKGKMINVGVDMWGFKPIPFHIVDSYFNTVCYLEHP